jgi:hypothetical protein
MAHSFKTNLGKSAFGVYKESLDANEYITNKTAQTTFCYPNVCTPSRTVNTQGNLLSLWRSNKLTFYKNGYARFNKLNLNMNLITKLDLKYVPVVQSNNTPFETPTNINFVDGSTGVFVDPYLNYQIDPSGVLFGNTICGINNYLDFVVYNPPYTTTDPGYINNV